MRRQRYGALFEKTGVAPKQNHAGRHNLSIFENPTGQPEQPRVPGGLLAGRNPLGAYLLHVWGPQSIYPWKVWMPILHTVVHHQGILRFTVRINGFLTGK
jgi:hypothetical protein